MVLCLRKAGCRIVAAAVSFLCLENLDISVNLFNCYINSFHNFFGEI